MGEFGGGENTKKKILICSIICIFLLLSGCGSKQKDNKIEEIEDIRISQQNNYIDCDDAILIKGFNDYQCVDTSLSYNEETGVYQCVIEFKKIISE